MSEDQPIPSNGQNGVEGNNGASSDHDALGKFTKGNGYAAKPGEVRNPTGRPPGRSLVKIIREMSEQDRGGKKLADALVEKAYAMALKGDFRFWKELIDRLDGPIKQAAEGELRVFIEYAGDADVDGEGYPAEAPSCTVDRST